ncbi:MAG TPA: glycine zipper family protein [Stellaceae bacterium]|nr:glycine zipper family protein [Stellaceae bacterium]
MIARRARSSTAARLFRGTLAFLLAAAVSVPETLAQGPYFYPAKGQSADQQNRDRYECHNWAVGQTGYDPSNPPPQGGSAPPPTSSAARGAVGGAAVGAVGGAIGGNAGKGAAIGAATGAIVGGVRRRNQERQQQAAQSQQASASASGRDAYNRALTACMQGRGYTAN